MILADCLFPPLTTVRVHHHKAGIEAARLIVEIIENAVVEPRHIVLPVQLIVRGSTRSVAAETDEDRSRLRDDKRTPDMKIGFAGLGDMGSLIVPRLMAAGHEVTGWNRTKSKGDELVAQGMRWADTPAEAARDADFMFSILTDGPAVTDVALGPNGISSALREDAIYIDMSTIAPPVSRKVAAAFAQAGLIMLDAPISGSPVTVRAGQASLMVGGDVAAFEKAKPVLLAIGPKVIHIGANGLACQMKIAVNLLLMVEVIAFGEAVALAEKGGRQARHRAERRAEQRRSVACARLSRPVHSRRQDAGQAAGRRHPAAEGHAAGTRARPHARKPGSACRRGQRNDERLSRARHRSPRFRHGA